MEVWKLLGIDEIIKKALLVDMAGEVILEHLLCLPEQDVQVLGQPKLKEMVATTAWYLWYERPKLVHGEETQTVAQIYMAVRCLAANYIISYSPKPKVRSHLVETKTWLR